MALPGKLCIGIIEEDNPQKSYFRFKPLIVADGDRFVAYDVAGEYPENGCIRIVPDKNESSRFKARMRRMGRWCMVDLREHPDENDKIRPNKNYHNDESETNAYIIYSDVVREIPEGNIVEIIPQDVPGDSAQLALALETPQTPRVVFSGFEPFGALWSHSPIAAAENGVAFVRTDDMISEGGCVRFSLPAFGDQNIEFIAADPGTKLYTPETAAPVAQPVQSAPQAVHAAPPAAPVSKPVVAAPAPAAAPEAPAVEKPWIHHDASILPPPIDPNMDPREQAIAMQTGLNPRRGRSLQEIIEEKWRRSRIDQLGHPVPGSATGNPAGNPVDSAIDAISSAWNHIKARAALVQALARIDGFGSAITESVDKAAAEEMERKKAEYKAEQENLAADLERCRAEREAMQNEMMRELEAKHTAELEEHAARVRQFEQDEAALKERADSARLIAQEAERAIAALTDDQLTARISEFAVGNRAVDIIMAMGRGELRPDPEPANEYTGCVSVPALVKRVRDHFCNNGHTLCNNDAVNLLACFAIGDKLLLTGPAGCGKTTTARLLMEALGISPAGRSVDYAFINDAPYSPAFSNTDSLFPAAIFADDINVNANAGEKLVSDTESLDGVRVIMTAQDSVSGKPLGLRLLDRAFVVNLHAEDAESQWSGPVRKSAPIDDCVTAAALNALFTPDNKHISTQVTAKMAALRKALGEYGVKLSRRTLNALWIYCGSVTPHMSLTPLEVFDLAFAQRALPAVLASASPEALHALPEILEGMPRCLELLKQPLAVDI